jgi:hypothetical protein
MQTDCNLFKKLKVTLEILIDKESLNFTKYKNLFNGEIDQDDFQELLENLIGGSFQKINKESINHWHDITSPLSLVYLDFESLEIDEDWEEL